MKSFILGLAILAACNEGDISPIVWMEKDCKAFSTEYWIKKHGFDVSECSNHLSNPRFKNGEPAFLMLDTRVSFASKIEVKVFTPTYIFYRNKPVKSYSVLDKNGSFMEVPEESLRKK